MTFIDWLKGKKTYLVMALALAIAFWRWHSGQINDNDLIASVLAALGGMSMRAAIAKVPQ